MFTDPQTITVNAIAQQMPRIETSGQRSVYQKADQTFTFTISHQNATGNRVRSLVKFEEKAVVPDPLTAVNDYENASIQFVIDRPLAGFSQTRIDQLVQGFKTWLTTTAVGQLYGRES